MLEKFLKKIKHIAKKLVLYVFIAFFILPVIYIFLLNWMNPIFTPLMMQRTIQGYAYDQDWRELSEISDVLKKAVIAAEDNKYCMHSGFDYKALKSQISNALKGKRSAGASTLSMQTAKNLFLLPTRSYLRKIIEAYYTVWLELLLDKQRIFELYLNIAEFGQGVYGAASASQYYFKKDVKSLSLNEATRLVTVLPGPLYKMPKHGKKARVYRIRVTQLAPKYFSCVL